MSAKNYHAWIKAARKAAAKTGGLSLPAARKAYKKMAAHVGRPLKGVDVKKHPIIFKRSIPKRGDGLGTIKRKATSVRGAGATKTAGRKAGAIPRKPVTARERVRERVIRTLDDFIDWLDFGDEIEYVSTAEYRKK